MECEDVLGLAQGAEICVTVWDAQSCAALPLNALMALRVLCEEFGVRSAQAQGLQAPVTDLTRLCATQHNLYIAAQRIPDSTRCLVLGGLKSGRKRLFVQEGGPHIQIEPVCLLDFYVHDFFQRRGVGFKLFEHFLRAESQSAEALAYDRPSPKLRGFLGKYFGLKDYVPQNNNFVIFSSFWATPEGTYWRTAGHRQGARLSRLPTTGSPVRACTSVGEPVSSSSSNRQTDVNSMVGGTADSDTTIPAYKPGKAVQNHGMSTGPKNALPGPGGAACQVSACREARVKHEQKEVDSQSLPSKGVPELLPAQRQWAALPPWAVHLPQQGRCRGS